MSLASSSAVHLPLDQLELCDLAFSLAIRPVRGDRCPNGINVPGHAASKGVDQALARPFQQVSREDTAFLRSMT